MSETTLSSPAGIIRIVDELAYSFGSADNIRNYPTEVRLPSGRIGSTSVFGILIDEAPSVVIGASGGASKVHSRSALILRDRLFMAIGDQVASFLLAPFQFEKSVEADSATCFALHFSTERGALICHGELEISRIREDLSIAWQSSGRDIFTGDFALKPGFVEAHDWDNRRYQFDYETGAELNASA